MRLNAAYFRKVVLGRVLYYWKLFCALLGMSGFWVFGRAKHNFGLTKLVILVNQKMILVRPIVVFLGDLQIFL